MWTTFTSMPALEKLFVVSAVIGVILVSFRLALQFLGGDVDAEAGGMDVGGDVDMGMGMDVDTDVGGHDAGFTMLSFQSISGFVMMFGLVGLALHRQSGVGNALSILGGTIGGLCMVWILAKLMHSMMKLQSSGTLNYRNIIGEEGEVYLTVPADGIGKVQVVAQGRQVIMNAKSQGDTDVKTGARVQVVNVVSGNMLVIRKL